MNKPTDPLIPLIALGGYALGAQATGSLRREIARLTALNEQLVTQRDRLRVRLGDPRPLGMFECAPVELLVAVALPQQAAGRLVDQRLVHTTPEGAAVVPAGTRVWLRRMGRLSLGLERDGCDLMFDPVRDRHFRMLPNEVPQLARAKQAHQADRP